MYSIIMEAYLSSLGQNDLLNQEWEAYKQSNYKYDPCYNYFTEAYAAACAENKRQIDRIDDAEFACLFKERMFSYKVHTTPCNCSNQLFCDNRRPLTSEEIKMRVYKEWLSYKYKDFKKNWKPAKNDGLNYLWLTFNFKDTTSVEVVKRDITRIVNHKIFDKCKLTYCYEYYTSEGSHPHVHMLVELRRTGTIAPSDLKDDIINKVKGLNKYLSITYYYSWATGKQIEKRCKSRDIYNAYIDGNKKLLKNNNCDKDKEWRLLNQLEDKYIKENI